jgi:hypothetical protein
MADDYLRRLRDTGRNDDCPCGSGKKYKKCHLREDEAKESKSLAKTADEARKKAEADGKKEDHTPQHPGVKHGRDGQVLKPHGPAAVSRQVSAPRKAGSA